MLCIEHIIYRLYCTENILRENIEYTVSYYIIGLGFSVNNFKALLSLLNRKLLLKPVPHPVL